MLIHELPLAISTHIQLEDLDPVVAIVLIITAFVVSILALTFNFLIKKEHGKFRELRENNIHIEIIHGCDNAQQNLQTLCSIYNTLPSGDFERILCSSYTNTDELPTTNTISTTPPVHAPQESESKNKKTENLK